MIKATKWHDEGTSRGYTIVEKLFVMWIQEQEFIVEVEKLAEEIDGGSS